MNVTTESRQGNRIKTLRQNVLGEKKNDADVYKRMFAEANYNKNINMVKRVHMHKLRG